MPKCAPALALHDRCSGAKLSALVSEPPAAISILWPLVQLIGCRAGNVMSMSWPHRVHTQLVGSARNAAVCRR